MKARTEIHTEMSNQQIEFGEKVGQVFYCTDNFSDCATDHSEFQGMLFYDANADMTDEIKAYIDSHDCMSVQDAKANGLTTRPNCRHEFHSIPLTDVIANKPIKDIQKDEGFYKGNYKKQNYDVVQEQRKNERMIRKYKMRVESKKQVAQSTGNQAFAPTQRDKQLIRDWQKRQRDLESKYPNVVKRNYEREKINTIVNDLGVKYDSK